MTATPLALWKEAFDAESYFTPFPVRAAGTFVSTGSDPLTLTLPNGYVTKAGDLIAVSTQFRSAGLGACTASGAGATWSSYFNGASAPIGTNIGYDASAGQTTIVLAGQGAHELSGVIAVFGGVRSASSPINASNTVHVGSAGATEGITVASSVGNLTIVTTSYAGTSTAFIYPSSARDPSSDPTSSLFRIGTAVGTAVPSIIMMEWAIDAASASMSVAVPGVWDIQAVNLIPAP